MGNSKITEELEFIPRSPVRKYQARGGVDYKKAPRDSVAPSDNIEKLNDYFMATSVEIYKTAK